MKKMIPLVALILIFAGCKKENNSIKFLPVTDKSSTETLVNSIDGVTAKTSIKIGTQRWMILNLNVSNYRNGDNIPQVTNINQWKNLTTGAWCWYLNDSSTGATYGKLYNWYAVNDPRGLAPEGWHVPSDKEWTTLTTFLGGETAAAGKMKETGTVHWLTPNTGATNTSGFTALPGGGRENGDGGIGTIGFWWSSSENRSSFAWCRSLYYGDAGVGRYGNDKRSGYSVRCLKN